MRSRWRALALGRILVFSLRAGFGRPPYACAAAITTRPRSQQVMAMTVNRHAIGALIPTEDRQLPRPAGQARSKTATGLRCALAVNDRRQMGQGIEFDSKDRSADSGEIPMVARQAPSRRGR